MNQRFVALLCVATLFVLGAALLQAQGALPPEESITKTTVPNQPVSFAFGAGDMYTDALVQITMQAACELKITRKPVLPDEIQKRCSGAMHPSVLVMENDQPAPGGPVHPSIYRIEPVGVCPAEAFPVRVDISYFGKFEKTGPNNKVFRLRMIHEPSDGSACRDITIGVEKLPNDPDPRGSGGEGGGYSDFFLLNLHDSHLPKKDEISNAFDGLIALVVQKFNSQVQTAKDAKQAFEEGATQSSKPKFEECIQKLKDLKSAVESARTAGTLSAGKAKDIQARVPQLMYLVQQFAATKGIDISL